VYAPYDSTLCGEFLDELRSLASLCSLPWLLVGHFNVTRSASEKNNHHFDAATTEALNDLIDKLVLQELPLLDRLFTWTNNREVPTLVRLDHIHLSPLERVVVQLDAAFARPQHLRSRAAVGGGHFSCSGLLVFSVRKFWATSLDYRALVEYVWARPSNQIAARGRRPSRKLKWSAESKKWSRSRLKPGAVISYCRDVISLLDLVEESRALSRAESLLRSLVKTRMHLRGCGGAK
jgi:hypothetical protein